jgi:hypothetical protein
MLVVNCLMQPRQWYITEKLQNNAQHQGFWPLPNLLSTVTFLIDPYTVKRVDGKLRQPDRMTQYSSIRVTEHFFDMLIKLIRRVSTKKMEYFEGIGTWRNFPTIFRQLSDHFPSTFRPFSVNFPTKESKSNGHQREANPHPSWLHSSTLPLRHTDFLYKLCVALWISLIAFYLLLSFVNT